MTPQSQSSPATPLRRRSTVALFARGDAPAAAPRALFAEAVPADRRQLDRWENEGGALGSAGVRPSAVLGGEAG